MDGVMDGVMFPWHGNYTLMQVQSQGYCTNAIHVE